MNKNFIVLETNRLDKFLAQNIDASRNQIEQLIKKEFVKVDGKIINKTGLKLKENQNVEVFFPEAQLNKRKDEEFLKNSLEDKEVEIIYEDDYILVLNKPYNLTVHDAPSVKDATLVDWLKLKNISLSTISGEERHGIVHRLDKGTSGVMVIAKTNEAHLNLSKQLEDKSMGRYYLAILDLALKENVIIEKPIGRNPNNRLKMSIEENGRYAKSAFSKIALSDNEKFELIACKLYTGRTHQIRVHLSSINRHILGDNLYGFKGELNKINRFLLHAYYLYLTHPVTNKQMCFKANLPEDIKNFLNTNFQKENINDKIDEKHIINSFSFTI
ncbi:RluA family pseudouridine synthase [Aliarcobacter butzleri]|jgi:23S rRNA pseudouridine1911/1915/1917 synthase|uniref:RluA family pseudouridine synthase n=1 Tax=Aliarcobacter butzleri TaxID=28197 RepID=UPI0002E3BCB8|nr:RluA family pseudouridine synthase [Aliarcobacter butzleri]AGR77312.1 23S rRNA pseudouridine synthase [Aliarcobacter butzleri 7h1h]MCG3662295.1 RluA family pseudouridine synthase [Aliarcobacter butzleri]MCG3669456.1 RluA family pseudouridine synthase [Aliarcobacter butzleri]MCG3673805.1 RluA family pseudouridine synthase [Aliarcobacter butzleri]MCG3696494.1 RluA family pseudouridine synthase [Aliarcobacter butzleri]